MKRRIGTFFVNEKYVHSGQIAPMLAKIEFVPTQVSYHPGRRGREYTYIGLANIFAEINVGEEIPEYNLIIKRDRGVIEVEVFTGLLEDGI